MFSVARYKVLVFAGLIAADVAWSGAVGQPAIATIGNGASFKDAKDSLAPWPSGLRESSNLEHTLNKMLQMTANFGFSCVITDKKCASVYVYEKKRKPPRSARAFLRLADGDNSTPDIGYSPLRTIRPRERTTSADKFIGSVGWDFEQDVSCVKYDAALSLHRVIAGEPADHCLERLASPGIADKRISCSFPNVPREFYNRAV